MSFSFYRRPVLERRKIMLFSSWLRNGERSAPRRRTQTSTRQRASFRPRLEALEDRTLLNGNIMADLSIGTSDPSGSGPCTAQFCPGESAAPGGEVAYALTVTNNGLIPESNVTLTDQLPANTTLVSWTPAPGWSNSTPPTGGSSGMVSASIDSLAPNSSATFILVVKVDGSTTPGSILRDTASLTDAANPSSNSISFDQTVRYAPTVAVVDAGGTYNGNPFSATAAAVGIDGTTPVAGSLSYTYYPGTSDDGMALAAVPVDARTYTVEAQFTSSDPNYNDSEADTTFTIAQATTDFSNLTMQQIITGTTTITASGQLTSNTIVPVGQSVSITLNNVTQSALVGLDGSFTASLDTAALGVGTYTISYSYAGDNNFSAASATGTLTIGYGGQLLFNNNKPVHSGAVLPIKLELTDSSGADISSSGIPVTAIGLLDSTGNAVPLSSAGNANPNDLFRYDASLGGYIFNLSTKGLAPGTYTLDYTAGNDPTVHSLTFVVV
jgi:uncharacterized repeat protein (TIGR01451 family)